MRVDCSLNLPSIDRSKSPYIEPASYLFNQSTIDLLNDMKKMFETEKSTQHTLIRIEKHIEKSSESLMELAKGLFSVSNILKETVNNLYIIFSIQ